MSDALKAVNAKLNGGAALGDDDIALAFDALMDGKAEPEDVKAFLVGTVPHMADPRLIAGGARALRARMIPVKAPADAIDVCGTGGDGAHTLNISTAAAFVVAGAGVPVAKHGNRAMSSKTGTADVLEALGVKLTGDVPALERCLREANIAFLFAQNHHPAMRHVAQIRRELGHRTIFNLLGPVSNPASVKRQLVGVFAPDFVEPMAQALLELGCERAWVVHGSPGLDELTAQRRDANNTAVLKDGKITVVRATVAAEIHPDLSGGAPEENAAELRALLSGKGRPGYRDAVILNAAGALVVAGRAANITEAEPIASTVLDSGAALATLEKLIAVSGS
jgi:anthranilate phosphoribosyltransferase